MVGFINERKDESEGQHLDRDRLAKAIAKVKGDADPKAYTTYLKKMDWRVNAKTGAHVKPNDNGKYSNGSMPYPAFAMSNADVKEIYRLLGQSGANTNQL
jgi:hypothetical protein